MHMNGHAYRIIRNINNIFDTPYSCKDVLSIIFIFIAHKYYPLNLIIEWKYMTYHNYNCAGSICKRRYNYNILCYNNYRQSETRTEYC
ncbi:hypothetical protein B8A07_08865 [Staphylococcus aureus]|nr:hypothetical protein B8A07_08865 [Staphylococcus aureus]